MTKSVKIQAMETRRKEGEKGEKAIDDTRNAITIFIKIKKKTKRKFNSLQMQIFSLLSEKLCLSILPQMELEFSKKEKEMEKLSHPTT